MGRARKQTTLLPPILVLWVIFFMLADDGIIVQMCEEVSDIVHRVVSCRKTNIALIEKPNSQRARREAWEGGRVLIAY